MSQGQLVPLSDAQRRARRVADALATACERVEIAGSIRRRKLEVRDIELVAVPRFENRVLEPGLLINESTPVDLLEERVEQLLASGFLAARQVANHRANGTIEHQTKLGPAFKALVHDGIPLDLFVVRPPASWGCIFALRTGPGDWNTRLVTDCQAIGRRVVGGQAWRWAPGGWRAVATPEEQDFLAALGQPWVEPEQRRPDRVRIERAIADGASA